MERKNSYSSNSNKDGFLPKSEPRSISTTSSEFVLQWGNRKKLRCMKVAGAAGKDKASNNEPNRSRSTARVDRRAVVLGSNHNNNNTKDSIPNQKSNSHSLKSIGGGIGYLNLRQRPVSPSRRILRIHSTPKLRLGHANSLMNASRMSIRRSKLCHLYLHSAHIRNTENSIGMRGQNNGVRGLASQDRGDRKGTGANTATTKNTNGKNSNNHHNENHHNSGGSGSSETAHDCRKGGSSSDTIVWPPKFVIALTNKEKEEDFMAIKGSKLPQRPKKRAKFIQRTLNLVSPGAWLCDLTLDRYEVREKKVSKKRPRGLKAMGNMESDSE
ncbi:uncharacterized protein LOC127243439 isoform X1 [Andrographis paniculata]|uniref:uncharacterized protein LOC127243439 isoform X1 n=1 Tax=Andrographis paniculata TaxID=175694 RepID=UPI0021E94DAC|nr:uncharacterized protein LOC127243439 isoform X1 [Andrographis paniculata]XP_051119409.1 uncharacterized protein LOC127243439 isoform X1 [Andrographis paniculata]